MAIMPKEDRRVSGHAVDLQDARIRVRHDPRGHADSEQEDRVDDEPAQFAGGQHEEEGTAGDRLGAPGSDRRGHDAAPSTGRLLAEPPRSSR
jgi:hypothetical protein